MTKMSLVKSVNATENVVCGVTLEVRPGCEPVLLFLKDGMVRITK